MKVLQLLQLIKRTNSFTEIREGLRVVWYYKWIAAMILMASVQLMMVIGVENVLLPVITKRDFGTASVFATSAALFSLGGAISAIICIKAKVKNPGLVSVVVWGLFIFAPLVLAFPSSKELIFLAYFAAGFRLVLGKLFGQLKSNAKYQLPIKGASLALTTWDHLA
jgi:hypothetical protein